MNRPGRLVLLATSLPSSGDGDVRGWRSAGSTGWERKPPIAATPVTANSAQATASVLARDDAVGGP